MEHTNVRAMMVMKEMDSIAQTSMNAMMKITAIQMQSV
jgi:hypothetical protein